MIRCRRLRQAPPGWRLQAAAGGAAGKGLPSRGDARRSPRRFSHSWSPSLQACAPPRGGRAERSPSGRRARSQYFRPGEDAPSALGCLQPPHPRLRLPYPHVVMAQAELKEGGCDLSVPGDCSQWGLAPHCESQHAGKYQASRLTSLWASVAGSIQWVNNFCHSSSSGRPIQFSNSTECYS